MANKWIAHIKKTMKMMKRKGTYKKGQGLKQVIMEAKKHWKKGGALEGQESSSDEEKEVAPTPEAGGRRRRHKRSHKRTHRRRHH